MEDPKPFAATASRIARAKREGDVARSSELSGAFAFAGACTAVALSESIVAAAVRAAVFNAARGAATPSPYLAIAASVVFVALAAGVCSLIASGLMANGFAVRAVRFELEKLHPAAGLRRMLSKRAALAAARALVAASIATALMVPLVCGAGITVSGGAMPEQIAGIAEATTRRILGVAVALGLCFGVADGFVEWASWQRRLRMSFNEMKQELKQSEGDPEIRGRRRSQHRALIRGSIARLPEASFVVANPSHVAIALLYSPPEVAVPRVLIRAIGAGAKLVKQRAKAFGIPVVENRLLAHMLLAEARIDEAIPRACYLAVARIVAALQSGALQP